MSATVKAAATAPAAPAGSEEAGSEAGSEAKGEESQLGGFAPFLGQHFPQIEPQGLPVSLKSVNSDPYQVSFRTVSYGSSHNPVQFRPLMIGQFRDLGSAPIDINRTEYIRSAKEETWAADAAKPKMNPPGAASKKEGEEKKHGNSGAVTAAASTADIDAVEVMYGKNSLPTDAEFAAMGVDDKDDLVFWGNKLGAANEIGNILPSASANEIGDSFQADDIEQMKNIIRQRAHEKRIRALERYDVKVEVFGYVMTIPSIATIDKMDDATLCRMIYRFKGDKQFPDEDPDNLSDREAIRRWVKSQAIKYRAKGGTSRAAAPAAAPAAAAPPAAATVAAAPSRAAGELPRHSERIPDHNTIVAMGVNDLEVQASRLGVRLPRPADKSKYQPLLREAVLKAAREQREK